MAYMPFASAGLGVLEAQLGLLDVSFHSDASRCCGCFSVIAANIARTITGKSYQTLVHAAGRALRNF